MRGVKGNSRNVTGTGIEVRSVAGSDAPFHETSLRKHTLECSVRQERRGPMQPLVRM
jgi:hypothetical protein